MLSLKIALASVLAILAFLLGADGAFLSRAKGSKVTQPKLMASLYRTESAVEWLVSVASEKQKATMPSQDYLQRNAEYAYKARDEIPVAANVPDPLFLQEVLPFRNLDEPVDEWRPGFFKVLAQHAKKASTLKEAVEEVVPRIFTDLRNSSDVMDEPNPEPVVFKSNSTPAMMAPVSEILKSGYASCTGCSILVVNGLRSVGIPARVVGTPKWNLPSGGNHNWVEVWIGDKEGWQFFDAAPVKKLSWGGWFVPGNTKHATKGDHGIFAAEWIDGGASYPLTWREPAVVWRATDRTDFYRLLTAANSTPCDAELAAKHGTTCG